jgi:hypothetical protein
MGHIHSGVAKTFITTGAGVYPGTINANQQVHITDIVTGSNAVTIKDGAGGNSKAVVNASQSVTLDSPITLTKGKQAHMSSADVTVGYVISGGAAIIGPAGYTGTATSY